MLAARQRRAMPAAAATALEMGLLLAYWELMARYHARHSGARCKSLFMTLNSAVDLALRLTPRRDVL